MNKGSRRICQKPCIVIHSTYPGERKILKTFENFAKKLIFLYHQNLPLTQTLSLGEGIFKGFWRKSPKPLYSHSYHVSAAMPTNMLAYLSPLIFPALYIPKPRTVRIATGISAFTPNLAAAVSLKLGIGWMPLLIVSRQLLSFCTAKL